MESDTKHNVSFMYVLMRDNIRPHFGTRPSIKPQVTIPEHMIKQPK